MRHVHERLRGPAEVRGGGTTATGPRRAHGSLLLAVVVLLSGCLRDPPPPTDPELAADLGLPVGTVIHTVHLAGEGARSRVLPSRTALAPGALVQFVVEDHRVHAVRFLVDEMSPEARAFLEATDQVASPPLVVRGSRHVLSFGDAPLGTYPYVVEGYGDTVRGRIEVIP